MFNKIPSIWGCGNNSSRETDTFNRVKIFGDARFDPNSGFFGRTDLRISLSRAKFDVEADFDVRSAVDRRKPRQISEKRKLWSENFAEIFFSASNDETCRIVRNAFWQSFAPIRAMFEQLRKKFHLNRPTGINSTASDRFPRLRFCCCFHSNLHLRFFVLFIMWGCADTSNGIVKF